MRYVTWGNQMSRRTVWPNMKSRVLCNSNMRIPKSLQSQVLKTQLESNISPWISTFPSWPGRLPLGFYMSLTWQSRMPKQGIQPATKPQATSDPRPKWKGLLCCSSPAGEGTGLECAEEGKLTSTRFALLDEIRTICHTYLHVCVYIYIYIYTQHIIYIYYIYTYRHIHTYLYIYIGLHLKLAWLKTSSCMHEYIKGSERYSQHSHLESSNRKQQPQPIAMACLIYQR